MNPQRDIIFASPSLIISSEYNREAHEDPKRRGGYVRLVPGEVPEIVLDRLCSEKEQQEAEKRLRRELDEMLQTIQLANADHETEKKRRALVRLAANYVVTRVSDPISHSDPLRRGGYLLRVPGNLPEIVLDGLATDEEQARAEQRCLRALEAPHHGLLPRRSAGSPLRPLPPQGATIISARTGPTVTQPVLLGQWLLMHGLLREDVLEQTLREQEQLGPDEPVRRLGSLLIRKGALSMVQVAKALGELRAVPPSLGNSTLVDGAVRYVFPLEALRELNAAPLFLVGQTLAVAMCDPQRTEDVATLQALSSYKLRPLQASQIQVHRLLQTFKGRPPGTGRSLANPLGVNGRRRS